jgi:hypothetical protein
MTEAETALITSWTQSGDREATAVVVVSVVLFLLRERGYDQKKQQARADRKARKRELNKR